MLVSGLPLIFVSLNETKWGLVLKLDRNSHKSKSNLHYTRGITPKRVTRGGAHLRG